MRPTYEPLEFITKHHELIASCLDTLESLDANNSENIGLLNQLLEKYNQFNIDSKDLLLPAGQHNSDRANLKLRIIASIAGIQNIVQPSDKKLDILYTDVNNGNIAYCFYYNYLVLIPPAINTDGEEQRLLAGLELLFEKYSTRYDWLVDCSSVKVFSPLTFSNLIYYQDRLSEHGNRLLIFWLSSKILPAIQIRILKQVFRLHEIGGQLFSNFKLG